MRIAGADVSYTERFSCAVITVFNYPEANLVEYAENFFLTALTFKYQPSLLFLREAPPLIETYRKLQIKPEILIVNGHGIAHPFNFGLATVLELTLQVPTIGCAKEPLMARYKDFTLKRENFTNLIYNGKTVGLAICTRDNTKPLIVSSGGKISLKQIKDIIILTTENTKFPLPLKEADRISRSILKNKLL